MHKKLLIIILFAQALSYSGFAKSGPCLGEVIANDFAKGFELQKFQKGYLLTLKGPRPDSYFIGAKNDCGFDHFIQMPVNSLAVLSTSFLYGLFLFESLSQVTSVDQYRYIYSEKIKNILEKREIFELGDPPSLEKLIRSKSKVLISSFPLGPMTGKLKLKNIVISDYLERDPLARLEWIKVVGLLSGKYKEAESYFKQEKKRYFEELAAIKERRGISPVIFGQLQESTWRSPLKDSYLGKLISDAGGELYFSNSSGVFQIENLLRERQRGFIWMTHLDLKNKKELFLKNRYYEKLKLITFEKTWSTTRAQNSEGANDFWQSAIYRPSKLIRELSALFNDDNNYQYLWFKKMESI